MISDKKSKVIPCLREIAQLISDKKGEKIEIYDLREVSSVTRFFIIATGYNRRHIQALCEDLLKHIKKCRIVLIGNEGIKEGHWALIDCGDFIIHIFQPEARDFYDLDLIWGDVPRIDWENGG